MRRFALVLAVLPIVGAAQAGDLLDGAGIRAALEGRKLFYGDGVWQDFRASGRTLYNAGADSWGNWAVRGDQYCSQWPPSGLWACYDVSALPGGVRFIDSNGETTDGTYAP